MRLIRQRKEGELQVLVRIETGVLVVTHRWQEDPIHPHMEGSHATHV